jgi:hypothetical protein
MTRPAPRRQRQQQRVAAVFLGAQQHGLRVSLGLSSANQDRIVLKHTTPRNMATAGRISGMVIQALRHLKQANIEAQMVARLRSRLTSEDKGVLLKAASLAPVWIGEIMREIAGGES